MNKFELEPMETCSRKNAITEQKEESKKQLVCTFRIQILLQYHKNILQQFSMLQSS